MTIKRKIYLLVTCLLLLIMLVIFDSTMKSIHAYVQLHMQRQAQATANSLGAALSHALDNNNASLVKILTDAVFDQGNFSLIRLTDANNRLLAIREENRRTHRAPDWFLKRFVITNVPGIYDIKQERRVVARLQVVADDDYMYRQLWVGANKTLLLLFLVALIAGLIVMMILRRMLRPLEDLEKQALAICNKEIIGPQPLPRSRELRRIAQAMNRQSLQLKTLFDEQVAQIEQVRIQAYVDSVSGLGNGRFFNAQLDARLHAPEEPFVGALARLQIDGLQAFNEQFGKSAGDAMLRQVGKLWLQTMKDVENQCVARVSGARFAALLPMINPAAARAKVETGIAAIKQLAAFSSESGSLRVRAGMSYCNVGESAHFLEIQADRALQASAQQNQSLVAFDQSEHGESAAGDTDAAASILSRMPDWQAILDRVLEQETLMFHFQPVVACKDKSVLYYEVLARLDVDGKLVNAGLFMPLVEREHKQEVFDQLVVSKLLHYLAGLALDKRVTLSINLSPHSIRNEVFVDWLLQQVEQHRVLAGYLIFEVPEIAVRLSHGKLKRMAKGLARLGAKLSIDHFGTTNSSFGYLSGLPLHSIKVDQSYIRDIEKNLDHQFFVQSLVRIAHSRNVLLTAEMVESEGQWELLRRFQLDGGQGYYLGAPAQSELAA